MKVFIRRILRARPDLLRPVQYMSPRWAREIRSDWRKGFTSYDLATTGEQPMPVCPFCFFLYHAKHGPEERRELCERAAFALRTCGCLSMPRRRSVVKGKMLV